MQGRPSLLQLLFAKAGLNCPATLDGTYGSFSLQVPSVEMDESLVSGRWDPGVFFEFSSAFTGNLLHEEKLFLFLLLVLQLKTTQLFLKTLHIEELRSNAHRNLTVGS